MQNIFLSIVFVFGFSSISSAVSLDGCLEPVQIVSSTLDFGTATMMTQHLTQYVHEYAHYYLIALLFENANASVLYTGEGPLAMPGALRYNSSSLSTLGDLIGKQNSEGIVLAGGDAANALLVSFTLYLNSMFKSKVLAYIAYGNAINLLGSMIHGYWAYLTSGAINFSSRSLKSDFQGIAAIFGPVPAHLYLGTLTYAAVRGFRHRAQLGRTWLDRGVSLVVPWTLLRTAFTYVPSLETVWGVGKVSNDSSRADVVMSVDAKPNQ